MKPAGEPESILGGYRVLDLADEKGLLCGMLLGDLGADVIKVEPPAGDRARAIGPFYHDDPDLEKSLYWFSYNRNKRSVTLDIATTDGNEIFRRLVATADFVIETFNPGYMATLGLGYPDLDKVNPRIIVVAITDWGQSGPYARKGWKADDMIVWALGGEMWLGGDFDRPPVQVSFPQAYLNAGIEAASAALVAHCHRGITGEGQFVDVAAQACLPYAGFNAAIYWDVAKVLISRGHMSRGMPRPDGRITPLRQIWQCKDGCVVCNWGGGALRGHALSTTELVRWMAEEGMADDLKDVEWSAQSSMTVAPEVLQHQIEVAQRFLLTKTKAEFYERAASRGIQGAPLCDAADIASDPQLHDRAFFVDIPHPELDETLTCCGAFAQFSETPVGSFRRAPLIGEHNAEVFGTELGFSSEELKRLKQAGVI